jgi:putative peptidoglycan lipid II flippase
VSTLLRSNLVVAAGTTLSRLTGLLRVAVFVYVIGRTALADVYTIANETPNIVYDLLIGGVLSATLVPLFSSFLQRDDEEATNVVVTTAVVVMTGLTVLAVLAAPLIFGIYSITPSSDVDADTLRRAGTTLTRIFLVQILFYGLAGVANAFLNSRRRFFAAAWSPIVANLVIVATLLSLPDAGTAEWQLDDVLTDARLRWTLGLGATGGIAAMALILVPAVLRTGFRFRPVWNWRHPAVRKLLTLSGWTIGFVAANQLTLVVVRNLAEPGSGDAAAYFFAFTFFVLPHGLLAVSISTTFQPEMALSVARRDRAGFIHHAALGTRMVALLTLPAGALMFVLREPIIGFALQRGAFGPNDTLATSRALAGFAVGLVGFSVYMFVLRGFYAHQDTRTPFIVNLVENALNIVFAFVLVGRYGVLGLGLAFALAYLLSAAWVLRILSYKVPGFPLRSVALNIARMGLAALLMAEIVWLVSRHVGGTTGAGALARVTVGGIVGMAAYVGILVLLRAPELARVHQLTVRLRPASK